MRFGSLLQQCIEESGASVRSFSQDTGVNRGWLYNIFSGIKSLPEDKFHRIILDYPFSGPRKEELRKAYYSEIYGEENVKKIKFILSALGKVDEDGKTKNFSWTDVEEYNDKLSYFQKEADLLAAIVFLIKKTAEYDNPYIYTNFSFEEEKIDNIFFQGIKKFNITQFYHITEFDSANRGTGNLNNIFKSIKYAKEKVNTYYHYGRHSLKNDMGLYPNFIVTNYGVLLYDKRNSGVLIADEDMNQNVLDECRKRLKECKPLVTFPQNVLEVKNLWSLSTSYQNAFDMGGSVCINEYMTKEIVRDIINKDIPHWEQLAESLGNYAEFIKSKLNDESAVKLVTIEGFRELKKTRRNCYLAKNVADSLSTDQVIEILDKMRHSNERVYILSNDIKMPSHVNFETEKEKNASSMISIMGRFSEENENSSDADWIIMLKDHAVADSFDKCKDYIIRNHFYYDQESADIFFNEIIGEMLHSER